jgi:hypothetical protein
VPPILAVYDPAGHGVHVPEVVLLVKVPAAHSVQTD